MMMEKVCDFLKSFSYIEWTKTTIIICTLPLILLLVAIHLIAILLSDRSGAIVSETPECAQIGRAALLDGGSVVDAAIAIMFCEGVAGPKEVGLGGGFTALLYVGGVVESLTATPTAPEKSPIEMIKGRKQIPTAMAGGIPGELLGYWEMHQKYGLLPWKRLIEPSVKLCKEGIDVSESQYVLSNSKRKRELQSRAFLYPEAVDGILKSPILAETLKKIADLGADVFYNGVLGEAFVKDVQEAGGFLTMNDLRNYNVTWTLDVISFYLRRRFKVYTTPLPSSGVIVAFAMNIIKAYEDVGAPVFWHRLVEASKHALGLGLTLGDVLNEPDVKVKNYIRSLYEKMLDMDFVHEVRHRIYDEHVLNDSMEYGSNYHQLYSESSVHTSVLAPNGDAISLTSSLLWPVPLPFLSKRTGIYWNDQLRAYRALIEDAPPGRRVSPWKRLLSPHAPVMVFPKLQNRPVLTLGATGGPYMPTQIIMALTRYCLMAQNIEKAINSGYLHPHMNKEFIEYDDEISTETLVYLEKAGHKINYLGDRLKHFGTVAIANVNGVSYPEISARHAGGEEMDVFPKQQSFSKFIVFTIVSLEVSLLIILMKDYFRAKRRIYYVNDDAPSLPY